MAGMSFHGIYNSFFNVSAFSSTTFALPEKIFSTRKTYERTQKPLWNIIFPLTSSFPIKYAQFSLILFNISSHILLSWKNSGMVWDQCTHRWILGRWRKYPSKEKSNLLTNTRTATVEFPSEPKPRPPAVNSIRWPPKRFFNLIGPLSRPSSRFLLWWKWGIIVFSER